MFEGVTNKIEAIISARDETGQGLTDAQRNLEKFGREATATGKKMMAWGAAGLAASGMLVKSFADFEEQMAMVATMVDDDKWMEVYKEGVRGLAQEFGEGTDTLAKGLYDILSAGTPASEAMDVLRASVIAGKAGMSDTAVAADGLTTMINAYDLEAGRAGDISDWFFSVIKLGKTTFQELAPVIGTVAPTAALAGLSLEDLGSVLALVTTRGVKTDMAVTGINATLLSFLKPTREAQEAAAELGIELSSNTIKSKGLAGIFEILAQAEDDQLAKIIPNVRAFRAVAVAVQDTARLGEMHTEVTNRQGKAQEAFGKATDTVKFALGQLKQDAVALMAGLGEGLRPMVMVFIGTFKALVGIFNAMPQPLKTIIALGLVLGSGLLAVGGFALFAAGQFALLSIKAQLAGISMGGFATATGLANSAGAVNIGVMTGMTVAMVKFLLIVLAAVLAMEALTAAWQIWQARKTRKEAEAEGRDVDELRRAWESGEMTREEAEERFHALQAGGKGIRERTGSATWGMTGLEKIGHEIGRYQEVFADIKVTKEDEIGEKINESLKPIMAGA
ncbi:MAG: phage tail tape measure protein [Dehalococcoidales bacterium]|nr:phage tail tape measure protein [Dehalococcoidales bacterium]